MIKKHTLAYFLLATLALPACQKDYVEPEFVTKSFGLYASFMNHGSGGANLNPTLITTNYVEGIKDLSLGEVSHEYSFWQGNEQMEEWKQMKKNEGVLFIKSNSNLGWGSKDDYSAYVDHSIDPTNSLSDITFLFDKPGGYQLKIRNVYDRVVRYTYSENDPVNPGIVINQHIDAQPIGDGNYEIVRKYNFEVYAPLVPSCKVYRDAEKTQEVKLDQLTEVNGILCGEVYINAGETLYFDDATGCDEEGNSTRFSAPTTRAWTWKCIQSDDSYVGPLPNATPATSELQSQAFKFDIKGNYTVNLSVERIKPANYSEKFPEAKVTKQLPVIVYVL